MLNCFQSKRSKNDYNVSVLFFVALCEFGIVVSVD